MKIKYELDVDRFTKVYNGLKVNEELYARNIDVYGLADKYDKTKDKDLQNIMYAINHNMFVEIDDIETIKKINNMYAYHDNPNKLTPSEIADCIKEMYSLHVKSVANYFSVINDITVIKNNNGSIDIMVSVQTLDGDFITLREPLESFTNNTLEHIKEVVESHNNSYSGCYTHLQQSKGFIGTIKSWFK